MKTLFAVTVLIAGIYLFIEQSGLEKIKQYLPQNQIEQNAESILVKVSQNVSDSVNERVDQKIVQLKNEILTLKSKKIEALEEQVTSLETKLIAMQVNDKGNKKIQTDVQVFPAQQAFATTQYAGDESLVANVATVNEIAINSDKNSKTSSNKSKAIKRQANLQDIAERMNKTSLLALTK